MLLGRCPIVDCPNDCMLETSSLPIIRNKKLITPDCIQGEIEHFSIDMSIDLEIIKILDSKYTTK